MDSKEILLTTDDVANRYKIDKETQRIYRRDGTWTFMKPSGRRIYYKKSMLDAWVEQNQIQNKEAKNEKRK